MKDLKEVIEWGRNKLVLGSVVLGLPSDELALTGGGLTRFAHNLSGGDLDFCSTVRYKMPQPRRRCQEETSRAFNFIDEGKKCIQLLKGWYGEPPYQFDWRHLQAYITADYYYFPDCFVTKKLEVGDRPLDQPTPIIRMVKWLRLGFTIDDKELKILIQDAFPSCDLEHLRYWSGS